MIRFSAPLHAFGRALSRSLWILLLALALVMGLVAGCSEQSHADEAMLVSAAANLQPVFDELGQLYQEQTGEKVIFNFASSGKLAQQIHEGAPVDVFISANARYVDELVDAGLVQPETKRVIARGRLVIWTPAKSTLPLRSLHDLARPEVERIAIANPDHAPYGAAARQALVAAGLWQTVQPRLVYGENVLQTFQFAASGDADAALVSLSQAQSSDGRWALIPDDLHQPLEQTAAVIIGSGHLAEARRFLDFLTSPESQALLRRYGYETQPGGWAP